MLLLILNINCTKKPIEPKTELLNLIYDSEDNIIKLGDEEWLPSWDFENNDIANDKYGMIYLYDDDKLILILKQNIIVENIYSLQCEKVEFIQNNNVIEISFPNLKEYMKGNDVFYFLLNVIK